MFYLQLPKQDTAHSREIKAFHWHSDVLTRSPLGSVWRMQSPRLRLFVSDVLMLLLGTSPTESQGMTRERDQDILWPGSPHSLVHVRISITDCKQPLQTSGESLENPGVTSFPISIPGKPASPLLCRHEFGFPCPGEKL